MFLDLSRYPHTGNYGTPLSQSLIPSYFLGPQTSLRFYLLSCSYAMLLLYLRLCEEHTVLFRIGTRFRSVDKPSFGFPVAHSRPPKPRVRLGASLLRCGCTPRGGPLKYF